MKSHTLYIKNNSDREILNWLNQYFKVLQESSDRAVLAPDFRQYRDLNHTLIDLYLSHQEDQHSTVKIQAEFSPWKDDIECAKSAYETLRCEVICSGGFPEPFFMWYVINERGQGLIDPAYIEDKSNEFGG